MLCDKKENLLLIGILFIPFIFLCFLLKGVINFDDMIVLFIIVHFLIELKNMMYFFKIYQFYILIFKYDEYIINFDNR